MIAGACKYDCKLHGRFLRMGLAPIFGRQNACQISTKFRPDVCGYHCSSPARPPKAGPETTSAIAREGVPPSRRSGAMRRKAAGSLPAEIREVPRGVGIRYKCVGSPLTCVLQTMRAHSALCSLRSTALRVGMARLFGVDRRREGDRTAAEGRLVRVIELGQFLLSYESGSLVSPDFVPVGGRPQPRSAADETVARATRAAMATAQPPQIGPR